MKEEGLVVHSVKQKQYNSYQSEINPEVGNLVARDFHGDLPNEKWVTDINFGEWTVVFKIYVV